MAPLFEGKKCSIFTNLFFLLFSISMLVVAYGNNNNNNVKKPTLFIFGDSTFDVGTNNFLKSIAKANILYNGIDFLHSIPTGRFSNGYNTADQIARQFGYMESPPPFLVLAKHPYSFKGKILGGANFASAGSGILRETGKKQWGEVTFLEKQVQQFKFVREKINEKLGEEKACRFVSNALFLISIGSNDLFDFARNETSIRNPQQYLASLQATYFIHIKNLYLLGARKFGILSIPPIGCCPAVTSQNKGNCLKPLNDLATAFYSATNTLLQQLSSELVGFKYSLGNTFLMTKTLLDTPSTFGLKETKSACCGIGYLNGQGPCNKTAGANLCFDRKDHLFWDWFHPSERASQLAAQTLVHGKSKDFVTPINLSQLART